MVVEAPFGKVKGVAPGKKTGCYGGDVGRMGRIRNDV
jgi:hypothetical protein